MNNFTKEELEKICQFFNIAIEDFNEPEETYALRDKIQGMIDNYCEHKKEVWPLYTSTGDLPSGAICYECNQCVDRCFLNE